MRAAVLLLSSLNYSSREVSRMICTAAARSFPSAARFTVSADAPPPTSLCSALPIFYQNYHLLAELNHQLLCFFVVI